MSRRSRRLSEAKETNILQNGDLPNCKKARLDVSTVNNISEGGTANKTKKVVSNVIF